MKWIGYFILTVFFCISSCKQITRGEYYTIQGFTQGTTYSIKYYHPTETDLQERIDSLLKQIDGSLSSYDSSSIISAINSNVQGAQTDSMFRTVFRESGRVYQITGGVFDITLGPLIDAWGFGSGLQQDLDSARVDSLLKYVGMDKVSLVGDQIYKTSPHVKLNVNAIAQGYSVDVVCDFLAKLGCKNYMVEIGGEIRTRGVNEEGNFWRIGIDRPEFGNMVPGKQLQAIISMHNRSLATSGNYRKYYEKDGVMITHTIDPVTGFPKATNILSISIITEECMTADAYATACMVMGFEKAKEFIENQRGVDAYIIYGNEVGNFQFWYSDGIRKYIESL